MDLITIVGTMCRNLNELCEIMYRGEEKDVDYAIVSFENIHNFQNIDGIFRSLFLRVLFFKRVIQSYVTFNTFRLYLYKYNQF